MYTCLPTAVFKKYFFVILILIISATLLAQPDEHALDTERFYDSAHHWYDIFDEERVINPLPEKPRYDKTEIRKIADNILLFQKDNGGWAKNFDMQAKLSDEQVQAVINDKSVLNTTFDNGATHSQLTYLAEVYTISGEEKYKEGFLKGMDFVLEAQYENGGWPQFYPDTSGYRKYITFNDLAMVGVMEMLQKIVQHYPEYEFIDDQYREDINTAYEKGIDCILKCQIIDDGVKTVWGQQHDNVTFAPRGARIYEKPSICNLESTEITKLLMRIENPDNEVIDAVQSAVEWFKNSEIHGIRVETVESKEKEFVYHKADFDRVVVEDPDAPRIWARFYELGTHRPIFSGRDGVVKYSMDEIDRDRRTGYGWYTYAPEEVYELYPDWVKENNIDRNVLEE